MSAFDQSDYPVGILVSQPIPKFRISQRVIYRVKSGNEIFDLRCNVLDVLYSESKGYLYQLSGLKQYLASDIKPESEIRLDTISR